MTTFAGDIKAQKNHLIHIFRGLNLLKTRPFSSYALNHKKYMLGKLMTGRGGIDS